MRMKRAPRVFAISALALGLLAVVLALTAHADIKLVRVDHGGPQGPVGIFSLLHSRPGPLYIHGSRPPIGGNFDPRFIEYQVWSNGAWRSLPIYYCGTGAQTYRLWPHRTYTAIIPLFPLTNTVTLARVAVVGEGPGASYRSLPFDTSVLR